MTRCPYCGTIYDESDYSHCPNCEDGFHPLIKKADDLLRIRFMTQSKLPSFGTSTT